MFKQSPSRPISHSASSGSAASRKVVSHVADAASQCDMKFELLLRQWKGTGLDTTDIAHHFHSEHNQLKHWIRTAGVYEFGVGSYDYFVKDDPTARSLVTSLLDTIYDAVTELSKVPLSKKTNPLVYEEYLSLVTATNTKLLRLDSVFRKFRNIPTFRSQLTVEVFPSDFEAKVLHFVEQRHPNLSEVYRLRIQRTIVRRCRQMTHQRETQANTMYGTKDPWKGTRSRTETIHEYHELPCCCLLLTFPTHRYNHRSFWTHLLSDLRPYVCFADDPCDMNVDFESLTQCAKHMVLQHGTEWCCDGYEHSPETFPSVDALKQHLRLQHDLSDGQMLSLLPRSRAVSYQMVESCPFCGTTRVSQDRIADSESGQYRSAYSDTMAWHEHIMSHLVPLFIHVFPPDVRQRLAHETSKMDVIQPFEKIFGSSGSAMDELNAPDFWD